MKIEQALRHYLVQLEADGRSPHTIGQYRRHVGQLVAFFREHRIAEITHEDVARFLSSKSARTKPDGVAKKASSMNALRTSVRTFFRYTHEAAYCGTNPARLVRRALCGDTPPRALSEDEQRRLLAVLAETRGFEAERDHALFRLMLATGIRIGSTLGLRVEDVDVEQGELLLRKMKGDRIEKVFLGRAIRDHLAEFVKGRRMGPLFAGRGGNALSARHVQRRLAMWCGRSAIRRRVSPHHLRHSFAMRLYGQTHDLLLVQQALRHRSISSTTVYARVDQDRLRAALAS